MALWHVTRQGSFSIALFPAPHPWGHATDDASMLFFCTSIAAQLAAGADVWHFFVTEKACCCMPWTVPRVRPCAEDLRGRLLAQTSDPALVLRLAPRQPGEADAARRARALYARLQQALGLDARQQAALQVLRPGRPATEAFACRLPGLQPNGTQGFRGFGLTGFAAWQ